MTARYVQNVCKNVCKMHAKCMQHFCKGNHMTILINHMTSLIINHMITFIKHMTSLIKHMTSLIKHMTPLIKHMTSLITHQSHDHIHQAHDLTRQSQDLTRQSHDFTRQSHDPTHQSHDPTHQSHDPTHQSHDHTHQSHDHTHRDILLWKQVQVLLVVQVLASGNELPFLVQGVHHTHWDGSEHNYTRMIKTWPQYSRECTHVKNKQNKTTKPNNKLIYLYKHIYSYFYRGH